MFITQNPNIDMESEQQPTLYYLDDGVCFFKCIGDPENVIRANKGSIASSTNGNLYIKTTDNVASGWVAISGSGGVPSLNQNEIAFGDAGNLMTSSSKLQFDSASSFFRVGESGASGSVRIYNTNGRYASIASGTMSSNKNFVLPIDYGTAGQAIVTDGFGNWSYGDFVPATMPGSDKEVLFNDGGSLNADSGLTYDKVTKNLIVNGYQNINSTNQTAYTSQLTINSGTGNELWTSLQLNTDLNVGAFPWRYFGIQNYINMNDGSITDILGNSIGIYVNGGNITGYVQGLSSDVEIYAPATVPKCYGIYSYYYADAGQVTNNSANLYLYNDDQGNANFYSIYSRGNYPSYFGGPILLAPIGTGAGNTNELRFLELAANGTNYTGFKAPDTLAGNVIYTLPSVDGSSGQALTTNGSGTLSFANATVTLTDKQIGYGNASNVLTGSSKFLWDDSARELSFVTGASNASIYFNTSVSTANIRFQSSAAIAGSQAGLIFPFIGGDQTSGHGLWWSDGSYLNTSRFNLQLGFNFQGAGASTSPVKIRKGTGTSSDGNIVFAFYPNSGFFDLQPYGVSAGETSSVRFSELAANGSNYIEFKAPDALAGNTTFTLPDGAGTAGSPLITNGSNTLSWSTAIKVDADNTAGNTRFFLYDVDNATLERVTVGIADSGGVGFKLLRIPN